MNYLLTKLGLRQNPTAGHNVSSFLRDASPQDRERVFLNAARKASQDQRKILDK